MLLQARQIASRYISIVDSDVVHLVVPHMTGIDSSWVTIIAPECETIQVNLRLLKMASDLSASVVHHSAARVCMSR